MSSLELLHLNDNWKLIRLFFCLLLLFLFLVIVTSIRRRLGCPPSTIGMEVSRLVPVEARLFPMAGRRLQTEKAKPTSSSE